MEQKAEWLARLSRDLKLKSRRRMHDLFYDADTRLDVSSGEVDVFFGPAPATGEVSRADFSQKLNETGRLLTELSQIKRRLDGVENFEKKLTGALTGARPA